MEELGTETLGYARQRKRKEMAGYARHRIATEKLRKVRPRNGKARRGVAEQ